jgi:hypothetical protein
LQQPPHHVKKHDCLSQSIAIAGQFKKVPDARRAINRRAEAYSCPYVGARRWSATPQMSLFHWPAA